jgi:HSP20 family protein
MPSNEAATFDKRIRKFFEDFDSPFLGNWNLSRGPGIDINTSVFTPRVDVTEDNENLYVEADLPGVEKKDVKVSVVGDVLTISGEKKKESRDENKNYYRLERTSGSFSRSFTLPAEIHADKIAAEFKDGVLKVTLPKTEEAKIVERQIEIK